MKKRLFAAGLIVALASALLLWLGRGGETPSPVMTARTAEGRPLVIAQANDDRACLRLRVVLP